MNIIAIGTSTGGPKALKEVLSVLKQDFPVPVLISQHIDPYFIDEFCAWLKSFSKLNVKIATEYGIPQTATIYIAPPYTHLEVVKSGAIHLPKKSPSDIYTPSCNRLFSTVAECHRDKAIGVILTGMGSDGASGMQKIRAAGGTTIAQDEASSTVFGMPKIAIDNGTIQHVLPSVEIGAMLQRLAGGGQG